MITLNVIIMTTKQKKSGFTLLELLVAMTIFAGIFISVLALVGNLQFTQKKIVVANDFYDESRLMMERVVQLVRNNTIDYDRYYEMKCRTSGVSGDCNKSYKENFYSEVGGKDRNLGVGPNAFSGAQEKLYLINAERTVRTEIEIDDNGHSGPVDGLRMRTLLGFDTDNDGEVDLWSDSTSWFLGTCSNDSEAGGSRSSNKVFCNRAHGWKQISPNQIQITNSSFIIGPTKDPYLAFKYDDAQIQPFVKMAFNITMRDESAYGFDTDEKPEIYLQTSASSRVYGSSR